MTSRFPLGAAAGFFLLARSVAAEGPAPIRVDRMWIDPSVTETGNAASPLVPPRLAIGISAADARMSTIGIQSLPVSPVEAQRADVHLKNAVAQANQGRIEAALLEVRDGLALNPGDTRLLTMAALCYSQQGLYERAAEYYDRYLEIVPDNFDVSASYAAVLLRLSRFEEAETILRRNEAAHADSVIVRFNRLCLDLIHEKRETDRTYWLTCPWPDLERTINWVLIDQRAMINLLGPDDFNLFVDLTLGKGVRQSLDRVADGYTSAAEARRQKNADALYNSLRGLEQAGLDGIGLFEEIASAAEAGGAVDEALRIRAEQTRRFPKWAPAWMAYGRTLLRAGRTREGREAIEQARHLPGMDPAIKDFAVAGAMALDGAIAEAQRLFTDLAKRVTPERYRELLDSDPALRAGFDRMPNHLGILRMLDIPPEMESK